MTHLIVNRVALAVCLLALTGAALFAVLVAPRPAAETGDAPAGVSGVAGEVAMQPGAALFERHCARCHEAAEVSVVLRAASGDDATSAGWRDFLRGHGAATDVEDAAIVAWLRQRTN